MIIEGRDSEGGENGKQFSAEEEARREILDDQEQLALIRFVAQEIIKRGLITPGETVNADDFMKGVINALIVHWWVVGGEPLAVRYRRNCCEGSKFRQDLFEEFTGSARLDSRARAERLVGAMGYGSFEEFLNKEMDNISAAVKVGSF